MSTSVIGLINGIALTVYPVAAAGVVFVVTGDVKKSVGAGLVTAVLVNTQLRKDPGVIGEKK